MTRASRLALVAISILGSLALAPSAPAASHPRTEREGARILRSVDEGERDCAELSREDMERVGEYAMGRMIGSARAHESMDELMATKGEGTAGRMHVFMGRRFAGCGGGPLPAGATDMMGAMMGMVGMMGGPPGSAGFAGMMDGAGDSPMPGARRSAVRVDEDDWGGAETAMVVMMAALLALAIAAVVYLRPGRRGASGDAREILDRRYARGELDSDEYRRQREALGGYA